MQNHSNPSSSITAVPVEIRLRQFRHRGKPRIGLLFPYNLSVKKHLLDFPGVRWTKSHRCFYIEEDAQQLNQLVNHCRGKVWIKLSDLRSPVSNPTVSTNPKSPVHKKSGKASKKHVPLHCEVRQKIVEYRQWLEQKRYRPTTVKTYVSFMHQFFSRHHGLSWDAISIDIITRYNYDEFIVKGKSYSAQNQWINAVKLYLRVNSLEVGDLVNIERPRRSKTLPNVLSSSEVQRILQVTTNVKHRTLLMLLYSSGLRIGEALDLQVKDIRSEEGLIYLRSAKGGKDRRVPLSPVLLKQLRLYYNLYRPRRHLFTGQSKDRYSNRSAANVLKRAAIKAGIKRRITLHTLRHSYATHLTQRGIGLRYVQDILGHQSPKTTMIYTQLSGNDLRTVRSPLDDMEL